MNIMVNIDINLDICLDLDLIGCRVMQLVITVCHGRVSVLIIYFTPS